VRATTAGANASDARQFRDRHKVKSHPGTFRAKWRLQQLVLAGTTRSLSALTAAVGQPDDQGEGPLSGSASNSQSRPSA